MCDDDDNIIDRYERRPRPKTSLSSATIRIHIVMNAKSQTIRTVDRTVNILSIIHNALGIQTFDMHAMDVLLQ